MRFGWLYGMASLLYGDTGEKGDAMTRSIRIISLDRERRRRKGEPPARPESGREFPDNLEMDHLIRNLKVETGSRRQER